ncbi:unnamed protein product [Hymenolepis diminuta]|uniref:Uncharacterized protein n=1 Tax=Hymenolepis diminuta TaxID=6216 RepID=A0A564YY29_HYMDI|nr:unnamed protein product [Hymenolepis diminuta]
MLDNLSNIFKCLKELKYMGNVVYQDLTYKSLSFVDQVVSLCGQKQQRKRIVQYVQKLKHPEEQE